MSAAKGNFLGLTRKSLLKTIWRMAKFSPTIFAGDRAWTLGCRYRTCSHLRPVTSMHVRALVNDVTDRVVVLDQYSPVITWSKGGTHRSHSNRPALAHTRYAFRTRAEIHSRSFGLRLSHLCRTASRGLHSACLPRHPGVAYLFLVGHKGGHTIMTKIK